jgi:site-specific recombinase XerD
MSADNFLRLARFWLASQRLSRSASLLYGRHMIRFRSWCNVSGVDPLTVLLSDNLTSYFDWMQRKPYSPRTIKHNARVFDQFRLFLLEVPTDVADRSS